MILDKNCVHTYNSTIAASKKDSWWENNSIHAYLNYIFLSAVADFFAGIDYPQQHGFPAEVMVGVMDLIILVIWDIIFYFIWQLHILKICLLQESKVELPTSIMSLINDMSATDALKLLDDQSSNEANASSLEYDTDEAENYFLKDDKGFDRLRMLTSPIVIPIKFIEMFIKMYVSMYLAWRRGQDQVFQTTVSSAAINKKSLRFGEY